MEQEEIRHLFINTKTGKEVITHTSDKDPETIRVLRRHRTDTHGGNVSGRVPTYRVAPDRHSPLTAP